MLISDEDRWNVNIHFHDLVVDAVSGAESVLDVGCGEGMLTRRLRREIPQVTGIDLHEDSVELARSQSPRGDIDYIRGDFLDHCFKPESFDAVVSVATLHHMDAPAALTRMKDLLRPGGTLVVVGLARNRMPADLPAIALSTLVYYLGVRAVKRQWRHPSPTVWPPPVTYREMRLIAGEVLPGSRFRRHLMPRYSIIWKKPHLAGQ
jgi:2-polyprenyl-3-methyl-5-hydroxy-6-metoxy-1,4-benzoquinol methylase